MVTVSPPRVRVVPLQPHCFAFGGFEIQMIAAMRGARAAGADIEPLDPWARVADFDIVHVWGLDQQHVNVAHWSRLARKKVVLSALVGYTAWRSLLGGGWRRLVPRHWSRRLLDSVDAVTCVNQ